jgi:5-methyltetrahydrofolate--homocysteine methyltransferase
MDTLSKLTSAVIEGKMGDIAGLTEGALGEGLSAKDILDKGLIPGMDYVGAQMRKGEMYIPEVLLSARTMQGALTILRPKLLESGVKMTGKVVIGTVKGDLHDIGKNLVGMMLEGAGFEVVDLGNNVGPDAFIQAIKEQKPDLIGMSALLTTTMRAMQLTVNALKEAGVRDQVKVMVGGAPLTQAFAAQIGADGYAPNASAAAELAKTLVA